jgi:hypothetical protein
MNIPVQRSHNRNMFPIRCGFRIEISTACLFIRLEALQVSQLSCSHALGHIQRQVINKTVVHSVSALPVITILSCRVAMYGLVIQHPCIWLVRHICILIFCFFIYLSNINLGHIVCF